MLVFVLAAEGIFAGFINGWYYDNPHNTLVCLVCSSFLFPHIMSFLFSWLLKPLRVYWGVMCQTGLMCICCRYIGFKSIFSSEFGIRKRSESCCMWSLPKSCFGLLLLAFSTGLRYIGSCSAIFLTLCLGLSKWRERKRFGEMKDSLFGYKKGGDGYGRKTWISFVKVFSNDGKIWWELFPSLLLNKQQRLSFYFYFPPIPSHSFLSFHFKIVTQT